MNGTLTDVLGEIRKRIVVWFSHVFLVDARRGSNPALTLSDRVRRQKVATR